MKAIALAAALAALAVGAAQAQDAGSIAAGRRVALEVCSTCHLVSPDQPFPPMLNQHVPSFAEIANRPGTSPKSLQSFIASTHWDENRIPMTMPNMMLTADQRRDVVRYILSLRRQP